MQTSITNLITCYSELILHTKIFENKTEEQKNKKPSLKSWSAAECIDYLKSYASAYLASTKVLETSPNNIDRDKNYSPRFFPSKFIKAVGPDTKLKLKSFQVGSSYSSKLDKNIIDQFTGY